MSEDFLEVSHITLPGYQPNLPDLQHNYIYSIDWKLDPVYRENFEKLVYNDCFYRNMHRLDDFSGFEFITILFQFRFEYIAVLDHDEVIVPGSEMNWSNMLKAISVEDKESNRRDCCRVL